MEQTKYDLEGLDERRKTFTLIDDIAFRAAFEEYCGAVELMLRVIIGNPSLCIQKLDIQRSMTSVLARSVVLDIYAIDDVGKAYEIEIQKETTGASPRRARLIGSFIDTRLLGKNAKFEELPDRYVIFLTKDDYFKDGEPIYCFGSRKYKETSFNDGSYFVYAHWSNPDTETELGRLLHDLTCPNPAQMYNPEFANALKFVQDSQKGKKKMSDYLEKVIEEVTEKATEKANEKKDEQYVLNLLIEGLSIDVIARCSKLTIDRIQELRDKFIAEGRFSPA